MLRQALLSTIRTTVGLMAVLWMAVASSGQACNVPVFRFALERWRPDPYRVTIFHRQPLAEAQAAIVDRLEEQQEKSLANFVVRTVAVDDLQDPADQALFASGAEPQIPWLVVQYPQHLRLEMPIWAGPLDQQAQSQVLDSPARKELVRRLADGQTAVWLLLECGDAAKDAAAIARLEEELKNLEQQLELPELTDSPDDVLLAGPELRVAFSVLRVPRSELEKPLVQMLLLSEPDLAERTDPLVFAVFGRGRALLPLVGAGITAENIHGSAAFLVGPCSCEIKELNPGFDLLLAADWDILLSQEGLPPETMAARQATAPGPPVLVAIPSGSPAKPAAASATPLAQTSSGISVLPRWPLILGGIAVVIVLAIIGLIGLKPRQPRP